MSRIDKPTTHSARRYCTQHRHGGDASGFTLVELLVVIAIIGVLVSLLLPAVQAAREAARRTDCKSRFKQLGIALHGYHDRMQRFPPGYISGPAPGEGPGWGWAAHVLDEIEETALRSLIDFERSIADPFNERPRIQTLAVPRCPSDDHEDTFQPEDSDVEVAYCNVAGVFGSNELEDDPSNGDGIFYLNSRTRMSDITDGMSNTLLLGERSGHNSQATWTGAVPDADEAPSLVLGDTGTPPNAPDADEDDFSSRHPQGAHFLMCDGAVVALPDSIDLVVWNAMATRAGGEVNVRAF